MYHLNGLKNNFTFFRFFFHFLKYESILCETNFFSNHKKKITI